MIYRIQKITTVYKIKLIKCINFSKNNIWIKYLKKKHFYIC